LRAVFQVLAAVDAGLVAYMVQLTTPRVMVALAGLLLALTLAGTIAVAVTVYRRLRQLE
jgi:hypothetical protein